MSKKVIPVILNGIFFKILNDLDDDQLEPCTGIKAECQKCITKKKIISGSIKATGNFYTHLRVRNDIIY